VSGWVIQETLRESIVRITHGEFTSAYPVDPVDESQ
jgi:hypothetical protein